MSLAELLAHATARPAERGRPRGASRERATCEAEGCRARTRERKPYCSEHLDLSPYVAQLEAELEEQRQEQAEVRRRGARAVQVDGPTAREVLRALLLEEERTSRRLAIEVGVEPELVEAYARVLRRAGYLSTRIHRRGGLWLTLLDQGREALASAVRMDGDPR